MVTEAKTWQGTPWSHQASLKGVGTDCIGFVGGVARALGIPGGKEWATDPEIAGYGRLPDPVMLTKACDKYMDRIPVESAGLGDVLVMRASNVQQPTHFAIVSRLDPTYILHSRLKHKVTENRLAPSIAALVVRAYRFRGVA